ncbi:transposase [Yersinia frederiksenii]|nr:transposase [Yersinia frederiksenii]
MTIAQKLEKKGRMEGAQETTLRIAYSLLSKGINRSIVKETTGLSDKELAQLSH